MRLPYWFPNTSAWLSAIFLLLLTGGLGVCVKAAWQIGNSLIQVSPRLAILFGLVGVLCPIALIALAHHVLQLFLDTFFPNSRQSEMARVEGPFPTLVSWWEGLYGWLVLVLSTIISAGLLGAIYYSHNSLASLYFFLYSWDKAKHFFTLPSIAWIVVAAFLYQFEFVLRRHLSTLERD